MLIKNGANVCDEYGGFASLGVCEYAAMKTARENAMNNV